MSRFAHRLKQAVVVRDRSFATIAVLGDSKAYQGGTGDTVIPNALKAKGWAAANIRISGVGSRVPFGGTVTPTTATSWQAWIDEGFDPRYMVMILGGNIRTSSQSTWNSQFTSLWNMVNDGTRQLFFLNLRYADPSDGVAFNTWFKTFIDARPNAHLIDQAAMIAQRETDGLPVSWASDMVHMNGGPTGYGLINSLIADTVDSFRSNGI